VVQAQTFGSFSLRASKFLNLNTLESLSWLQSFRILSRHRRRSVVKCPPTLMLRGGGPNIIRNALKK
jgi:hypothetical protein